MSPMRKPRRQRPPSPSNLDEVRRVYWELSRRCRPVRRPQGEAVSRLTSTHHATEVLVGETRCGQGTLRAALPGIGGLASDQAFSDEVDIDFPSVSRLVARMRRSFFGADPSQPLATDVRLTRAQAENGVEVPVDLSLRHTCPACGGRGEVWLNACSACGGAGTGLLPHALRLIVPPGVSDGTRLRFEVTPPYAPVTNVHVRISVTAG